MLTCSELALTAQLICFSAQTPVCTDNGSIAQILDIPDCTSTELSQSNDDGDEFRAMPLGLVLPKTLKPILR